VYRNAPLQLKHSKQLNKVIIFATEFCTENITNCTNFRENSCNSWQNTIPAFWVAALQLQADLGWAPGMTPIRV